MSNSASTLNTFDKETSHYERKKARQAAIKVMDEVVPPESSLDDAASIASAATSKSSTSSGRNRTMKRASFSTGNSAAIVKARQFLWDEDEVVNDEDAEEGALFKGDVSTRSMFSTGNSTPAFKSNDSQIKEGVLNSFISENRNGDGRSTGIGTMISGALSRIPTLQATQTGDVWSKRINLSPQGQHDAAIADSEEMLADVRLSSRGRRTRNDYSPDDPDDYGLFMNAYHGCMDRMYLTSEYMASLCAGCCAPGRNKDKLIFFASIAALILLVYGIAGLATYDESENEDAGSDQSNIEQAVESDDNDAFIDLGISNQDRFEAIQGTILESGFTDEDDLITPGTAQFKALRWLTDYDESQISERSGALLQRYALATLFFSSYSNVHEDNVDQAINDGDEAMEESEEGWEYHDNWMSEKGICMWWGVNCPVRVHEGEITNYYNEDADVMHLNLTDNNIMGTIPPEIQALENLITLDLSRNKLRGVIPPEIGGLKVLVNLYLIDNQLQGEIPPELGDCYALRNLHLGTNDLRGTIPENVLHLRDIRAFGVDENYLSGPLPDLTYFTKLLILYVDDNQFTGTIPAEYGSVTSLMDLRLRKNFLHGTIPNELSFLSRLELLYLDDNGITGTVPDMFESMPRLREIQLYKNKFEGPLPKSIQHLPDLNVLYLDNNKFTGTFPPEYGTLGDLKELYLYNNELTGSLPEEIETMRALSDFRIHQNHLTGPIPERIFKLYELENLYLNANEMTGTIPSGMSELIHLRKFQFFDNKFEGTVAEEVCDLVYDYRLDFMAGDCDSVNGNIVCRCCHKCYP